MHGLPWALMGDFNEVLSKEEKYGGNPVCQRRVRAIKECMDVCHMMDLGFPGPKFTWTNKREVGDLIQCRLDRCWANSEWKRLFEEANVTHLVRVNFDHYPLLLKLSPNLGNVSDRPFRFQPVWLNHKDFTAIVREAWAGQDDRLDGAISSFKAKALRWNKEVFGNVFVRKKQIMARLLGIQKALALRPNTFLLNLQNQLTKEYNLILQMKEEIWAMKAMTDWIIMGERNTSYFHKSTLVRRSKNIITCI